MNIRISDIKTQHFLSTYYINFMPADRRYTGLAILISERLSLYSRCVVVKCIICLFGVQAADFVSPLTFCY